MRTARLDDVDDDDNWKPEKYVIYLVICSLKCLKYDDEYLTIRVSYTLRNLAHPKFV